MPDLLPDMGIYTHVGNTPCGEPIYATEMSTFDGSGRPDPVTGKTMYNCKLEQKGEGDERYWVTKSPSGVFLRIFND